MSLNESLRNLQPSVFREVFVNPGSRHLIQSEIEDGLVSDSDFATLKRFYTTRIDNHSTDVRYLRYFTTILSTLSMIQTHLLLGRFKLFSQTVPHLWEFLAMRTRRGRPFPLYIVFGPDLLCSVIKEGYGKYLDDKIVRETIVALYLRLEHPEGIIQALTRVQERILPERSSWTPHHSEFSWKFDHKLNPISSRWDQIKADNWNDPYGLKSPVNVLEEVRKHAVGREGWFTNAYTIRD